MAANIKAKLVLDTNGVAGSMGGEGQGGAGAGSKGILGVLGKIAAAAAGIFGVVMAMKPMISAIKLVTNFFLLIAWPFMKPVFILISLAAKALVSGLDILIKTTTWLAQSFGMPILRFIDHIGNKLFGVNFGLSEAGQATLDTFAEAWQDIFDSVMASSNAIIASYKKENQARKSSTESISDYKDAFMRQKEATEGLTQSQRELNEQMGDAADSVSKLALSGTTASDIWGVAMRTAFDATRQFSDYMKQLGEAFGFSTQASGALGSDFDESQTSPSRNKSINFMGTGRTVREVMRFSGNTLFNAMKSSGQLGPLTSGGTVGTGNFSGGKFFDANLLITSNGRVMQFDQQDDMMISAKKNHKSTGGGGGVTVNINNPSVRKDSDIRELVRQVSQALMSQRGGYSNYGLQ